ncbi:electron transport complex protein RnfA [Methanohalophilus euhalobius]|jgi:electron transport complex protein RnfA|uniref:Ion-translocating oxidoreductase complex subunit A n=1 Tax=Methanohalophilus euhalobius TaxID=51203 RepID=A0A285F3W8_9EURY|nr:MULTISPECIES: Rnf electron transport complex subunit RnfA [Methanohalophilus]RSD33932.1 MAG: electron transport complex protein RnfA [Methanohalophilus sp.]ODV49916.1 MAG: electron transport complex protein RnfA [Methanohalophilus sp. 2-GBenrich]RSD35980.1 MAG: electron transport complex protein RnfA [Methanohalophilus sp.]RXG34904.1 electron transport complex protein RnfA [Methanohalophilus sp. WG1-DM]TCL12389.1 electron transport complex protein RnfA [Methanohalophilus euhalobius]
MVEKALFAIFMEGLFIKNFLIIQFLGLCSFLGVTKDTKSAAGMSGAVIFVMTMASIVSYVIYTFVLIPLDLQFLRLISFIVVIAALVQLVEFVVRKNIPSLYRSLGIYLPLITTNCAVLGVVLLNVMNEYSFLQSLVFGISAGMGYTIVMVMMSSIREKTTILPVPSAMRGLPQAFLIAAMLSMAFVNYFKVIPL